MRKLFNTKFSVFTLFGLFAVTFFINTAEIKAQDGAVGIDPTRIEVVIPAGSEKTVGTTVDYGSETGKTDLPLARLVARMEDWTIATDGDVKFAPVGTLERSASSWVTMSSSEFTLTAQTQKTLRFTISVPKGTPPGDYLFAAYVESRDAPPPPKENEKRIVISFRHYLLVYVLVPNLTAEGELQGLEAKIENGRPTAFPKLANSGNSRLRPKHKFEITDASNKTVFASDMSEARVLLGGHSWRMAYPITANLPAGKYTLKYTVDFVDKKAIQVGKTNFEITGADVAARQKSDEQAIAENKAAEANNEISLSTLKETKNRFSRNEGKRN